jgi:antitoxin (DNA-binding transcriptional repressor) of toxin-antitoxin stability system
MGTVRISEADAIRDIAGLLARAQQGEEIVIETKSAPAVILRKAEEPTMRTLSESLRIAQELGSTATLDGDFEKDLNAVIASHPEPLQNPWD